MLYTFLSIIIILVSIYLYWRFLFFYRDPERKIPTGNNVVSPADGTIVYIKKIDGLSVPLSIKNKKEIKLEEIFKFKKTIEYPAYLVGIFMHPTSVHVNRAPISGIVENITYTKGKNLLMTMMWWRILLGLKPYEKYSKHIFHNERNTLLLKGNFPVYIIQIADIYVNKIECWIKQNEVIQKGQRFGMIKMGSQVDILFPVSPIDKIIVNVGDKVIAGESIIALLK